MSTEILEVSALIIFPDVRAILSFIGIFTLISGVWYVDRTWDEKGSAAFAEWKDEGTPDGGEQSDGIPEALKKRFDEVNAFPFPYAFLLGWVMVAVSHLFTHNSFSKPGPGILALLFSLALGVIASVPMGDAVLNRKAAKKKKLGMMFVLSWIFLSIFTGLNEDFTVRSEGLGMFFCLIGAITVVASMKVLWKARKMGDTWEQEQKPNPKPVVYNMGGPLFVFGFFLYWVGMNGYDIEWRGSLDCWCLPVFFNARTFLTVFAGCGMVPVVMCLDCAHDSGAEFHGWRTDGRFFGAFFESPIPFIMHWTLFGASSFISIYNGGIASCPRPYIILFICIAQGVVAGVLIQRNLYRCNMEGKKMWSKPFVLLFLLLAVMIGFSDDFDKFSGYRFALSILGTIFVIAGQKTVFGDRVKGDYWMEHDRADNPNPIVYSVGEPLFMFGWILLSLAMTMNY